MKPYSKEWKLAKGKWIQKHILNGDVIWKIHYIEFNTEYSRGKYFSVKEAKEELKKL